MKRDSWLSRMVGAVIGSGLGITIALVDRAAPFGDDSSKATIVLWLASSGLLGFAMPQRPWVWAVAVGPWLPAMYLLIQVLGWHAPINPNTYTTSLILIPISLVVCTVGAYVGALGRRLIQPPRSAEAGAAIDA